MGKNNNTITVEDYKIWYPYEVFYIESMFTLAHGAIMEVAFFHEIIRQIISDKFENKDMLLDSVQNFITYSASLARYFWPSSKEKLHTLRAERLREAFSMDDDSALKDKRLRNFIEHFDEKLDSYLSKGIVGNIIPNYIGLKSQITEVDHFFRAYFLDEASIKVLDLEYKVDPIIQEVQKVHNLLIDFRNSGGRLLRNG
jgi:hypothetical protein